jgi:Domain of unknown function (DUF1996)
VFCLEPQPFISFFLLPAAESVTLGVHSLSTYLHAWFVKFHSLDRSPIRGCHSFRYTKSYTHSELKLNCSKPARPFKAWQNFKMAQSSLLSFLSFLALAGSPVTAFWRLPCASPVVVERADPIINPGVASPHLHTVMGGNGFGFNMDYAQTQASQCSSCTVQKDLSNYWIPNLWYQAEDGNFTSVPQVGGALVYYL